MDAVRSAALQLADADCHQARRGLGSGFDVRAGACFHRPGMDEHTRANKSENHRYLLGIAIGGGTRHRARYWGKILLLWLVLVTVFTLFWFSIESGREDDTIADSSSLPALLFPVILVCTFVFLLGFVWVVRWRAKRAMLAALQSPEPAALVAVVAKQIGARLPDRDAYVAQVQALAYAVYGRAAEARRALTQVDWSARVPLVASLGYFAEAWVVLLCDRNVAGARRLFTEAAARAAVNPRVPGAATVQTTYAVNFAVCDVLSGDQSTQHTAVLEQAVSHHVSPYGRLLAAMGLAALMEATGNATKASELRAFIASTAPHCAVFRLTPRDFTANGDGQAPAVPAYLTGGTAGAVAARRPYSLARTVGRVALLWAALIVGFLFIYQFLNVR